jgi:hypothetical protein
MCGTARLLFEHEPNRYYTSEMISLADNGQYRPFLLALFHYIGILGKRGCSRTALEYCKLLLRLDPSDPFAVHLSIDNFALRSKSYDFLPQFLRLDKETRAKEIGMDVLPNFAFSLALAKFFDDTVAFHILLLMIDRYRSLLDSFCLRVARACTAAMAYHVKAAACQMFRSAIGARQQGELGRNYST